MTNLKIACKLIFSLNGLKKKQQQNVALQVKQIIRPVKMAIENINLFVVFFRNLLIVSTVNWS